MLSKSFESQCNLCYELFLIFVVHRKWSSKLIRCNAILVCSGGRRFESRLRYLIFWLIGLCLCCLCFLVTEIVQLNAPLLCPSVYLPTVIFPTHSTQYTLRIFDCCAANTTSRSEWRSDLAWWKGRAASTASLLCRLTWAIQSVVECLKNELSKH